MGKRNSKQGGIGPEFVTFWSKSHIVLHVFAVPGVLQGANNRPESGATTWGNVILSREALAQNLSLFEAIVTLPFPYSPYWTCYKAPIIDSKAVQRRGKRNSKQGGLSLEFVTFWSNCHIVLPVFAVPACYKAPIIDLKVVLRRGET